MSLNKFTLDIESSSAESTMDDATEDEASINQIIEFSDSDSEEEKETTDIVDATKFIIPTQHCIVIPTTPANLPKSQPTSPALKPIVHSTDLHEIAMKIKRREESNAFTETERNLIDNSSRHEKGYSNSICRIEKIFFDTMEETGTDSVKKLLVLHDDGLTCERLFYIKLRGLRSQAK